MEYKLIRAKRKTIELSINVYGKEHANTAMCYNNIGALYEDQGDLEQALDFVLQVAQFAFSEHGLHVFPSL